MTQHNNLIHLFVFLICISRKLEKLSFIFLSLALCVAFSLHLGPMASCCVSIGNSLIASGGTRIEERYCEWEKNAIVCFGWLRNERWNWTRGSMGSGGCERWVSVRERAARRRRPKLAYLMR